MLSPFATQKLAPPNTTARGCELSGLICLLWRNRQRVALCFREAFAYVVATAGRTRVVASESALVEAVVGNSGEVVDDVPDCP